jgi:hypothetical protein
MEDSIELILHDEKYNAIGRDSLIRAWKGVEKLDLKHP